jgi:hypothetical protein
LKDEFPQTLRASADLAFIPVKGSQEGGPGLSVLRQRFF